MTKAKSAKSKRRPQPPRMRTVPAAVVAGATQRAAQPASPRLVFKPEVLDRVGVTYPALWQWMREGRFPQSREVGGKVAWLEHEVDEWILNRPRTVLKPLEAVVE